MRVNAEDAKAINPIQEIMLRLLEEASFNGLNGVRVATDLRANKDLWQAALIDRSGPMALIKLRDLPAGHWNVDTLFILPVAGKEDELEKLAARWDADEIRWTEGECACTALGTWARGNRGKTILSVWWD